MTKDTSLIDDQSLEADFYQAKIKAKNKIYTRWVFLLILIINILYQIRRIGTNVSFGNQLTDSLAYSLVIIPILATIWSIPVALIPYKGSFAQEYKRTFLLTLLFLNTAFILLLCFSILSSFYDYIIS
jgi:hypothetical protein